MKSSSAAHRSACIALMIITIILGLAIRRVPVGLPYPVVKYGGSMLWAMMIYWIVSAVASGWTAVTAGLFSALIATLVEFFKLYHEPVLDAFRRTLAGSLLLGRFFSIWDLVAYWLAIVLAVWLDRKLLRRGGP